ncbi:MAG: DUF2017 family protein [Nitriliruptor sp.]|nr:MAG: DUF2017 family protein [Nitriliruptor sp.]
MTATFVRRGELIRLQLRPQEVTLLTRLAGELRTALEEPGAGDPVVARLFPPAVLGDPEADREVRDLLADALLADRLTGLEAVLELLERGRRSKGRLVVDLVDDEPLLVLGVLNDIRLAIGARIDIEALDRDRLAEDDPVAYPVAVMDHLGWWQEQLLTILDGRDPQA